MNKKRAVLYLRVSKNNGSQDTQNQLEPLKEMAKHLELKIVKEYRDNASGGSANRPQFQQMLQDAKKHKFNVILVWALDRLTREGMLPTLSYIKQLRKYGVEIRSQQEQWVDSLNDEYMGELMIAFASWFAGFERKRISERTKAGQEIARANGKQIGRPFGSKDKKRRVRAGYLLRWANVRA